RPRFGGARHLLPAREKIVSEIVALLDLTLASIHAASQLPHAVAELGHGTPPRRYFSRIRTACAGAPPSAAAGAACPACAGRRPPAATDAPRPATPTPGCARARSP